MKNLMFAVLCCFLCSFSAFGQQITGTVVDAEGTPIIGATITEKGTNNVTSTNVDGKFQIKAKEGARLLISYIGCAKQEIKATNDVIITMKESAQDLDEVVVVGYGTVKKADLTGSVASVTGKDLANLHATSISQSLQGSMPGVSVTRSSGLPGASATIRVRGITTIGDSDPLIIIDGIPGSLESVNSEDIESISVLKDAASASIYGSRAAAGVILVTTKRAKDGNLNIEYSGSVGFVRPTTFPKTVDYKTYMNMVNEVTWNDAGNNPGDEHPVYTQDFIDNYAQMNREDPNNYPITDWRKALLNNTAPTTKHNVALMYGNKTIKSKCTLGYENTDALYDYRSYSKITARTNNNLKVNKWLTATFDASYRRAISKQPQINPMKAAYVYGPLWTPTWTDGRISEGRNSTNAYAILHEGGFDNSWHDYITGKFSLIINPLDGLTITGVYAPQITIGSSKNFSKKIPWYQAEDPNQLGGYISGYEKNNLSESRSENRTSTKQLLINYDKTFAEKHKLSLLAGYEDFYSFTEIEGAGSNNLDLSNYPYLDNANLNEISVNGNAYENAYRSLFGRVSYDFNGKYLLQANVREDYSSRFAKSCRNGTFPSFSAGWVISEENFMKALDLKALNFLKLRASWGTLGNERIGNYPYQALINFSDALFLDGSGNLIVNKTAAQREYNVANITWETTKTWDFGLDASLLNNRLSCSFDYYKKNTHNMLLKIQLPIFMGYGNPDQNGGEMHTNGWELQLGWHDRIGDFGYGVSFNLSDYKSVMGNLSGTVFTGDQIMREGSEYYEWYGYVSDGLFLDEEDLANYPKLTPNVKLGDIKYKDISGPDGVPDGKISADYDRVLLGGSQPRYTYGGTINMDWKGFDLSLMFQGVGKQNCRMTSDMVYQQTAWYNFPEYLVGKYYSHYNTPEQNAKATLPLLSTRGYEGVNYKYMSDFWLFDGSYFRLKNITLGYTLPKKICNKISLKNVRFYASVSDVFTIDHFPQGWDPEAASNGYSYIAQTYNFGVNVKF